MKVALGLNRITAARGTRRPSPLVSVSTQPSRPLSVQRLEPHVSAYRYRHTQNMERKLAAVVFCGSIIGSSGLPDQLAVVGGVSVFGVSVGIIKYILE